VCCSTCFDTFSPVWEIPQDVASYITGKSAGSDCRKRRYRQCGSRSGCVLATIASNARRCASKSFGFFATQCSAHASQISQTPSRSHSWQIHASDINHRGAFGGRNPFALGASRSSVRPNRARDRNDELTGRVELPLHPARLQTPCRPRAVRLHAPRVRAEVPGGRVPLDRPFGHGWAVLAPRRITLVLRF
jgi:hypothetical protein